MSGLNDKNLDKKGKKALEEAKKSPKDRRAEAGADVADQLDQKAKATVEAQKRANEAAAIRASAAADAAEKAARSETKNPESAEKTPISAETDEVLDSVKEGDREEAGKRALKIAQQSGDAATIAEAKELQKEKSPIAKFLDVIIEFFKKLFSAFGNAKDKIKKEGQKGSSEGYSPSADEQTRYSESSEYRENYKHVTIEKPADVRRLVEIATKASSSGTPVKEYPDLKEKNPPLYDLIQYACDYYNFPPYLLYATFRHESGFKHGIMGDKHLEGGSLGIGQFRPDTFVSVSNSEPFKKFMDQIYPGKQFERGENLLADIVASICYHLKAGQKFNIEISQNKPLTDKEIRIIRASYNAGTGNGLRLSEKKKYYGFARTVRNFEKGYQQEKTNS